jgi:uncharacterized protein (DUF697 family)
MANKRTHVANMVRIWKIARGLTGPELRGLQSADPGLAIAGAEAARAELITKLGGDSVRPAEFDSVADAFAAGNTLVLDAESAGVATDLDSMLAEVSGRSDAPAIALAYRYPAFRPIVAEQLTRVVSAQNAKIAAISALPGIIPLTDWLLPAASAGDMIVLTHNQIDLMLRISACYGLPPDPRDRLVELIPIVGGAFGWRAIARELVGIVPGGVGVAVKAAVAYAGTYTVGRAVSAYYANAKPVDARKVFRNALVEAISRGRRLLEHKTRLIASTTRISGN